METLDWVSGSARPRKKFRLLAIGVVATALSVPAITAATASPAAARPVTVHPVSHRLAARTVKPMVSHRLAVRVLKPVSHRLA